LKPLDLRLYAVTDPAIAPAGRLAELVAEAIAGGATLVQLRDKSGDVRTALRAAEALLDVTRRAGVPLLVNDRVDVALAVEADGVHLGQDDMPVDIARRLLGPRAIIGLTVRSEEEARGVPPEASYAAIGGVFATSSKADAAKPIGLDGLARLAALIHRRHPSLALCAISGITAANAGEVVRAGVDGVAVISSLFAAADARAAASALRAAVDAALLESARA